MKNYVMLALVGGLGAWFLFGSGGSSGSARMSKVLDRSSMALATFQKHLETQKVAKVTDTQLKQLADFMRKAVNQQPAVYASPVGVNLLKDATFEGFNDPNRNNLKESSEKRLFKLEVDFDNKRLIASNNSGSSMGMGLAAGFLGGMLMSRLMGNQRAAGIRPGHFNKRNVSSRSSYARSRARSGGRFGGK